MTDVAIRPMTVAELLEKYPISEEESRIRSEDANKPPPAWETLCELEPRLVTLAADIQAESKAADVPGRSFCANGFWYGFGRFEKSWKEAMCALVGWERKGERTGGADRLLRTCGAYDVAYQHLYDLLPDCRECACW